jgi:diaminopimelate epimerase
MPQKLPIKFTKMHGLGNDFIVIDAIHQTLDLSTIPINQLSHRYTGIGFDQLIWLETSDIAEFSCRFFNADGSEAEQCGNGVRCLARYVHENGFIAKNTFQIETKSGAVSVRITDYNNIEVSLGIPALQGNKSINLARTTHDITILSMGNPHAILQVDSVKAFPVTEIGSQIATHSVFPQGTNVGFVQVINSQKILLRTYERGVGETYACGSNACAAVVAGITNEQLNAEVTVELALGELQIRWDGAGTPVIMKGPAEKVFDGVFQLSY